MATRWARLARGWLAAVVSTTLAAAAHMLAGEPAPGALVLALALAFAFPVCSALSGSTVSLGRLALAVAMSQLAFHALFSALGGGGSSAPLTSGLAAGRHAHGVFSPGFVAVPPDTAHQIAHTRHDDPLMMLAHAAAGIVTLVALRYGEGAFWRLAEIALLLVRTALAGTPAIRPIAGVIRRPGVSGGPRVARPCANVRLSLGLRGPPLPSIA